MRLWTPLTVGPLVLPNRVAVTAMVTRLSGSDGVVNDDIVERYLRFAEGGSGLIVVEATSVHGGKSGPLLKASSDEFIPGLRRIADAVHGASDSKVFLQIIHFLKVARSGWRQKLGDVPAGELEQLPAMFAGSARRAREAGMDGVELHMAHAYTMSSFLSRYNKRRDQYGGSLENRMRMPSLVVATVRRAVGDDYPVGVRFDAEECIKDGYSLKDSKEFATRFAELGAAYVSLSAGGKFEDAIQKPGHPLYPYTGYSGDRCMPGQQYEEAFNIYLAEGIRSTLRARGLETPVIGTGKIGTPELAERLLVEGKCDVIGMARALLADPYWTTKFQRGRGDEVIRCTYCNVCKNLDESFRKVICYLWPHGSLQAPRPGEVERADLVWSEGEPLRATCERGKAVLRWAAPRGGPATGYDIYRSSDGCDFERVAATTRRSNKDEAVIGGRTYSYYVQAYDTSGSRSLPSNIVRVRIPHFTEAGRAS